MNIIAQYHISFPIFRLTVAVYYDDIFHSEFGDRAITRIEAIMAIVDEMYSEKDTLTTEFEVSTVAIEHAQGRNWALDKWVSNFSPWSSPSKPEYDLSRIAINSSHEANIYVFFTGKSVVNGLGRGEPYSVCDTSRDNRVNINKYASGSQKGGDAYTAEVYLNPIQCGR